MLKNPLLPWKCGSLPFQTGAGSSPEKLKENNAKLALRASRLWRSRLASNPSLPMGPTGTGAPLLPGLLWDSRCRKVLDPFQRCGGSPRLRRTVLDVCATSQHSGWARNIWPEFARTFWRRIQQKPWLLSWLSLRAGHLSSTDSINSQVSRTAHQRGAILLVERWRTLLSSVLTT